MGRKAYMPKPVKAKSAETQAIDAEAIAYTIGSACDGFTDAKDLLGTEARWIGSKRLDKAREAKQLVKTGETVRWHGSELYFTLPGTKRFAALLNFLGYSPSSMRTLYRQIQILEGLRTSGQGKYIEALDRDKDAKMDKALSFVQVVKRVDKAIKADPNHVVVTADGEKELPALRKEAISALYSKDTAEGIRSLDNAPPDKAQDARDAFGRFAKAVMGAVGVENSKAFLDTTQDELERLLKS